VNSPASPAGGRLVMSAGVSITLIAAGGILRFAVATTSTHGLNVHVVGVILILAGVLGLLLSLVWGVVLNRRPAGYGRAAPALTRQRFPPDQPPTAADRRVYQDQPPV
jgi:hypothetical protein